MRKFLDIDDLLFIRDVLRETCRIHAELGSVIYAEKSLRILNNVHELLGYRQYSDWHQFLKEDITPHTIRDLIRQEPQKYQDLSDLNKTIIPDETFMMTAKASGLSADDFAKKMRYMKREDGDWEKK